MKKKDLYIIIAESCILILTIIFFIFAVINIDKKRLSAYEMAVKDGFTGTEQEWIASLQGKSAYEIAVENGFIGTEKDWIASLQGKNGQDGSNATIVNTFDLYQTAKEHGEITDDGYTYLDFLRDYFSTSNDYSYAVASKNLMSVVTIYSYVSEQSTMSSTSGSGVIINLDNEGNAYIVTNYHVTYYTATRMYGHYKLYLYNTDTPIIATYVGGARSYDISVLKVENSHVLIDSNAQIAKFREESVSLGESCYAIGDTNESGISLTKGVISVENEVIRMNIGGVRSYYREIRHDSYIYHGNSGGGLFDKDGFLIGITNGGVENSHMNYAIPIDIVKPLTENIIANYEADGSTHAKTIKIGIDIVKNEGIVSNYNLYAKDAITMFDVEQQKIVTYETVIINKIDSGSLLDAEGTLKLRDQIISIEYNGRLFENIKSYTLNNLLLSSKSGDVIKINVKRIEENNEENYYSATIVLNDLFLCEVA